MPKSRKKRSAIWKPSRDEFIAIFNECNSIGDMLSRFGLRNVGSNYKTLTTRFKKENMTWEKFKENKTAGLKNLQKRVEHKNEDVFIENSSYNNTSSLKKKIFKFKLLENKCYICNLKPEWNGLKLVMILDHINGNRTDNRIENLRLLCPNCNSQTDTFAGRNKKYMAG